MRSFGSVVVGVLVGVIVVAIVEWIGTLIFPLPDGVDPYDTAALSSAMKTLPAGAFAFVLLAWFAGTFIAAWLAAKIARSRTHGLIVAALLLVGGLVNLIAIPHPVWVWVAGIAAFVIAGLGGAATAPGGGVAKGD